MGYTSTAKGVFLITPPLNHQDLKRLPDLTEPYGAEIELDIEESELETQSGTLISRKARTVRPLNGDEDYKRYDTATQLQALMDAFPHHIFTGYFEFLGEDGERWRTLVKNGQVIDNVKPELRWPE